MVSNGRPTGVLTILACLWFGGLAVTSGFLLTSAPLTRGVPKLLLPCSTSWSRNSVCPSMVYVPSGGGEESPDIFKNGSKENPSTAKEVGKTEKPKGDSFLNVPLNRNAFLAMTGLTGFAGYKWVTTDHTSRSEKRRLEREAAIARLAADQPVKETPAEARLRRQQGKKKEGGGALETTAYVVKEVAKGVATVAAVSAPVIVKGAEIVGKDIILPAAQFTGEVVLPSVQPVIQQAVEVTAPVVAPALENAAQSVVPILEDAKVSATGIISSSVEVARPALEASENAIRSVTAIKDESATVVTQTLTSALRPALDITEQIQASVTQLTDDATMTVTTNLRPVLDGADAAARTAAELKEDVDGVVQEVEQFVEPAVPVFKTTWGIATGAYSLASAAVVSVQEKGFGGALLGLASQTADSVGAFVVAAAPKVLQFAGTAAEVAWAKGKVLLESAMTAKQDSVN